MTLTLVDLETDFSLSLLQAKQYTTTVLSAMMSGMDDKEDVDDVITLEAMSGLKRVMIKVL